MTETTMKRGRLEGYSPEDKARIKSLAIQLVTGQMVRLVKEAPGGKMTDAQFDKTLQEIMPEAVETARATVVAVNEYLS